MTIKLTLSEMEIDRLREVMIKLTDGESEYWLDYSDPKDVAQAVSDVISEIL